jgi:hypothetical protein
MCELAPLLTIKCAELSNLLSLVRGQKELENPYGYSIMEEYNLEACWFIFVWMLGSQEKDDNLTGEHAREGLTCIVAVKVPSPEFEGQTKVLVK